MQDATALPPHPERWFWAWVDKRGPDECWPWLRSRTPAGYGRCVPPNGEQTTAQRVAWTLATGQPFPPKDVQICHSCDNPPCCNPAHLWPGSMADNMEDMRAKGRHPHGVTHPWHKNPSRGTEHTQAKLSEAGVRMIRAIALVTPSMHIGETAERFGVTDNAIRQLVAGKTWGSVSFTPPAV